MESFLWLSETKNWLLVSNGELNYTYTCQVRCGINEQKVNVDLIRAKPGMGVRVYQSLTLVLTLLNWIRVI